MPTSNPQIPLALDHPSRNYFPSQSNDDILPLGLGISPCSTHCEEGGTMYRRVLTPRSDQTSTGFLPISQTSHTPKSHPLPSLFLSSNNLPTPITHNPKSHSSQTSLQTPKGTIPCSNVALPPLSPDFIPHELHDGPKRSKLSNQTMDKVRAQPFDQLRRTVLKCPEYKRLTIADKLELDDAYRDYQSTVYCIAIKNKLTIQPVLEYLGNSTRTRGPSCYNNFCRYDKVAGQSSRDKSLKSNERAIKCGALWRQLTPEEQKQWKDQDYLDSLAANISDQTNPQSNTTNATQPADEPRSVDQSFKHDRFSIRSWARKTKRELCSISTAHQVEGYVVLASRDASKPVLLTAGSHMAEEFLDILSSDNNQCESFYRFISGKQAVFDVSGTLPPPIKSRKRRRGIDGDAPDCPYDLGSKKANAAKVRELLKNALIKATHGVWQNGWPGTNTAATLTKLGVTLSIQQNDSFITTSDFCKPPSDMYIGQTQRVLMAFAKGWVKLTGPPEPNPSTAQAIGGCLNTDSEDESDSSTPPDLGTSPRPKQILPRQKHVFEKIGIIRKPIRAPKATQLTDSSDASSIESEDISSDESSPSSQYLRSGFSSPNHPNPRIRSGILLDSSRDSSPSESNVDSLV